MTVPVDAADGTYIFYPPGWSPPRRGRNFTWSNATIRTLSGSRNASLGSGALALTTDQVARVRLGFAAWAAAANVTFTELAVDSDASQIRLGRTAVVDTEAGGANAGVYTTGGLQVLGPIRVSGWHNGRIIFDEAQNYALLSFQETATHEIGHILGLAHPTDQDQVMSAIGGISMMLFYKREI